MTKIGFIGCGNMGGALATAISKFNPESIFLYDKSPEKAEALASAIGAHSVEEKELYDSDFLFLGVKPHIILPLLSELADKLSPKTVLVSMAAGVKIAKIKAAAPKQDVIRIMPNTPVEYSKGMVLCATSGFCDMRLTLFREIMSFTGTLDEVDEELIDAGTAVSGCGPAFVYMFIKGLLEGGKKAGLSEKKALLYAVEMVIGAATTLKKSGKDAEELVRAVCSPGGSTIEGVNFLKENGFYDTVSEAVAASYKKTKLLGNASEKKE